MANAPVTGTPKASGAPSNAPSQTIPVTAKGAMPKGVDGHPAQGPMAAQPPSNGSTNMVEGGPSVNYDANQETAAAVTVRHPNAVIPLGEQDQRT